MNEDGETIQGLRENLTQAIDRLSGVDSSVAVSSGGELFLRFISLTSLEHNKILTHSSSRVVLRVLEEAAAEKKRFTVKKMAEALKNLNVPVTVVLDAAVG